MNAAGAGHFWGTRGARPSGQLKTQDSVYDGRSAFEAVAQGMIILLVESPPVGTYPRRFKLTGTPERTADAYKEQRDLTSDVQANLGNAPVEWYVPRATS